MTLTLSAGLLLLLRYPAEEGGNVFESVYWSGAVLPNLYVGAGGHLPPDSLVAPRLKSLLTVLT